MRTATYAFEEEETEPDEIEAPQLPTFISPVPVPGGDDEEETE